MIQYIITIVHIGWEDRYSDKCNDAAGVTSRYDDAEDPVKS
jgi:hypothetical protein